MYNGIFFFFVRVLHSLALLWAEREWRQRGDGRRQAVLQIAQLSAGNQVAKSGVCAILDFLLLRLQALGSTGSDENYIIL